MMVETKREMKDPSTEVRSSPFRILLKCLRAFTIITLINFYALFLVIYNKIVRRKKSVKGKVCLVTGSGRGIGQGLAEAFGKLGAKVICVDINERNNAETAKRIIDAGGEAEAYTANICKDHEIQELSQKTGPIDILVLNAALVAGFKFLDSTKEEIIGMFNVNVISHYWLIKAFLPSMIERNEGHIVTISSVSSEFPPPYLSVYAPTKAAATNLAESLRFELKIENKDNKIKITTVLPTFVNTSADYTDTYKMSTRPLSIENVVKSTMNSILLEEEDVTIPGYMRVILKIGRLQPMEAKLLYMTWLLKARINLLSKESRNNLPFSDIVDDSK